MSTTCVPYKSQLSISFKTFKYTLVRYSASYRMEKRIQVCSFCSVQATWTTWKQQWMAALLFILVLFQDAVMAVDTNSFEMAQQVSNLAYNII